MLVAGMGLWIRVWRAERGRLGGVEVGVAGISMVFFPSPCGRSKEGIEITE